MMRLRRLLLALLAPSACLEPYLPETSAGGESTTAGGTSTSSGASTPTSSSSSTACTISSSTGAEPDDTVFITLRDHPPDWCDVWNDDCPEGQKCTLVSLFGHNSWDTSRCVPLVAVPDALYEPCSLIGSGSDGRDTCDRHAICLISAPADSTGTCIGLCTGSSESPVCADPEAGCIEGGPPYGFCFPPCDPLSQNCGEGSTCIPHPFNADHFMCFDSSGDPGALFAPCQVADECVPGLFCADSTSAVECDPKSPGCCLPFCDLDDPNTCPGAGQQCVPWTTEPCDAAPSNADVGACALT